MKSTTSDTRKYRTEMNNKILNSGFTDFKKFFTLDNKAYIDHPNTIKGMVLDIRWGKLACINGAVTIPNIPYRSLGKIPILLRSSSRTSDNKNTTQIRNGNVRGIIKLFNSLVLRCFVNELI